MPYGPVPPGARKTRMAPVFGSSRPYTPLCPVNQSTPRRSKVAVLRLAQPADAGSGHVLTALVPGSTRTIALRPLSVTHAAPSGPTTTPWGAEPAPRGTSVVLPVAGSSRPSVPVACAVYQ